MFNEMFEGSGRPHLMNANFQDMAHFFVLQNVKLMDRWCK